ncbi:hypothetical protein BGZ80_010498 [Entomortierella chlamydospora]|uniref:Uncharacterized protein n=1 Tax=Entomortierella chlamydospora TaxID=101097 RepID=A0A9P6T0B4_9FUNG|nr:hypothetical protein BGZ80_010498 [Entomortierella chlamydospora]
MDTTIDLKTLPTHGHHGDHNQNPPLLTSILPLLDEKDSMASGNTSTITKVTRPTPRSNIGCVTQFFVEAATRVINLPGYSQEYYDETELQTTSHEPEIKGCSLFIFDSRNPFRKRMCWPLNQKQVFI